jgi:hypothetical protein
MSFLITDTKSKMSKVWLSCCVLAFFNILWRCTPGIWSVPWCYVLIQNTTLLWEILGLVWIRCGEMFRVTGRAKSHIEATRKGSGSFYHGFQVSRVSRSGLGSLECSLGPWGLWKSLVVWYLVLGWLGQVNRNPEYEGLVKTVGNVGLYVKVSSQGRYSLLQEFPNSEKSNLFSINKAPRW